MSELRMEFFDLFRFEHNKPVAKIDIRINANLFKIGEIIADEDNIEPPDYNYYVLQRLNIGMLHIKRFSLK